MIDSAYLNTFAATLGSLPDVCLDPGLADSEVDAAENQYGFIFPPDLRAVLQFTLLVGEGFPNWRHDPTDFITGRLNWPLEGILFDVEHNDDIWPAEWGPRPERMDERFAVVTKLVVAAPKLDPIYSHRYIPAEPHENGNPVYSVYQTDIIYYGTIWPITSIMNSGCRCRLGGSYSEVDSVLGRTLGVEQWVKAAA